MKCRPGDIAQVLRRLPGHRHLPHSLDLADFNTQTGTYGDLRSDGSQTGGLLQFTIDSL